MGAQGPLAGGSVMGFQEGAGHRRVDADTPFNGRVRHHEGPIN
jgi:hypothetical protein